MQCSTNWAISLYIFDIFCFLNETHESAVSVIYLSPDHFRRKDSRPVSCYAIFKGWLLLSQPPGCWWILTSSSCTEYIFRDLNWRSGLFPFWRMELLPHCLTAVLLTTWYSEFDRLNEISPYFNLPVLYPQEEHTTPTLKLFRREPAITEFD